MTDTPATHPQPAYLTTSKALLKLQALPALLNAPVLYCNNPVLKQQATPLAVLAWGRKPSATKAEQLAQQAALPLLRLEDGFLRSVELGLHSPPLSIVQDNRGIYYDAGAPSQLEQLISQPLSAQQRQRARALIQQWQHSRVSKYNHSREQAPPCENYILVIDQTFGDAAIAYGNASAQSFSTMLQAALANHPEQQILLKIHPDVFTGKKRGHFSPAELQHPRITVLTDDIHAPALLEHAAAVYCVTSQMGFEALLWQKPVYTFGMPFYAGWGLTHDALPAPLRRNPVTLPQLVYAALIAYPRYLNPETGQRCEVEQLISWMALQRQQRQRFAADLYSINPSRWKRPILRRFVQGSQLHIVNDAGQIPPAGWQLVWGNAPPQPNVIRVEDGFIRSVGLGADMIQPASWVLDSTGMYYDATRPSDLENLLNFGPAGQGSDGEFSPELLARAKALQQQLVALNITKYNIGRSEWQRPAAKQVVLVPGQVETDASIKFGSPVIKTNLALLQAVRAARPTAWIIYKPHPDVVAGLRSASQAEQQAQHYCNDIITDQDMASLLNQVDEVHTLTSLTGFEALLRNIPVVCYGQPFYAGWGLTTDIYPHPRRTTKRSLSELIAAALICYPTYISAVTGKYTTPEQVIKEIQKQRSSQPAKTGWRRQLTRLLQRCYTALR
jgi:capsular polysaccharide export protein